MNKMNVSNITTNDNGSHILRVQMQYYRRKALKNRLKSFFMRPVHAIKDAFGKKQSKVHSELQSTTVEPRKMTVWERKNDLAYMNSSDTKTKNSRPLKICLFVNAMPRFVVLNKTHSKFSLVISTARNRYAIDMANASQMNLEFDDWDEMLIIEVYNDFKLFGTAMTAFELFGFADYLVLNFNEPGDKDSITFVEVIHSGLSSSESSITNVKSSDFRDSNANNKESSNSLATESSSLKKDDSGSENLKISQPNNHGDGESLSSNERSYETYSDKNDDSKNTVEIIHKQSAIATTCVESNEQQDTEEVIPIQNIDIPLQEPINEESEEESAEEHQSQAETDIDDTSESESADQHDDETSDEEQDSEYSDKDCSANDIADEEDVYDEFGRNIKLMATDEPFLRRRIYEQIDVTNRFPSELHENVSEWREVLLLFSELPYFEESYEILRYDCLLVLKGMYELPYARCDDLFYKMDFYRIQKYCDPDDPVYWDADDPFFWQWRCDPKVYTVTPSVPAIERLERRMKLLDEQNSRDVSFEVMCRSFAAKYCTPTAFERRRCPEASLWDLFKDVTEQIPVQQVLDLVEPC